MKSCNILYFSSISVSWVSFVRAALTEAQEIEMWVFDLSGPVDLRNAFHQITETTVDAYFWDWAGNFDIVLGSYVRQLDRTVRTGINPAPRPQSNGPLELQLAALPRKVYLIRYSNLTILNKIKNVLVSTYRNVIYRESLLGMIGDDYVTTMWNDYARYRNDPQSSQLEVYIVQIAVLFSLNRAMLVHIPPHHPLRTTAELVRLENYQLLISRLHSTLAGYMQIETLIPYKTTFGKFQSELASAPIHNQDRIRDVAYRLCDMILPMIAIYGRPPRRPADFVRGQDNGHTPGTLIISDLLVFNAQWSIQRLIGRIIRVGTTNNADWLLELMRCIDNVLKTIDDRIGPWSLWMVPLRPMLKYALDVLDPSGAGSSGAGPSGTN